MAAQNTQSRNWQAVRAHFQTGAGVHRSQERAEKEMKLLTAAEATLESEDEPESINWDQVRKLKRSIIQNKAELRSIECRLSATIMREDYEVQLALQLQAEDLRADIERETCWIESLGIKACV